MEHAFRPFAPGRDEPALIDLLTGEEWTHRPKVRFSADEVRAELAAGHFAGPEIVTELIELDGAVVGLVRAEDVGRERTDPQLDFRLRASVRGRGIGLAALRHITALVFDRSPATLRIEGQTRRDNVAMRKVFQRGGYVLEAVYRRAWPAPDGTQFDGVGYAMLRGDWESGTTTPVDWS